MYVCIGTDDNNVGNEVSTKTNSIQIGATPILTTTGTMSLCNIRYTQYTIDQQPLDDELVKKVFRIHFAELTDLLSEFINRLTAAVKLFSEELISETCYDEAVDSSPRTDIAKGISLANAVKSTINGQPQLIVKLISVLKKLETFNSLANKLSHDLCL